MPSAPFTSTVGITGQYHSGSIRWFSSYRKRSTFSSTCGNNAFVTGLRIILFKVLVKKNSLQLGEDVTGRCRVLASLQSSTKLTIGQQQIDVVRADVVLRQIHNCHHQRLLSVVVGGQLSDSTGQLCNFYFLLVSALEACKENLENLS